MGESILTRRNKRDIVVFYDKGDEYTALTGGWVDGPTSGTGTKSKNIDNLYMETYAATGDNRRGYATNNLISFAGIKSIFIECTAEMSGSTGARTAQLRISDQKTAGSIADVKVENNFTGILNLDVSALSGDYYIQVFVYNSLAGNVVKLTVNKIWGEK